MFGIKHFSKFTFKYKICLVAKMGIAYTSEFEAEVRAESYESAKKKLIGLLRKNSKIEPIITYPVEEMR